jgi:DNA (cytosine-5)-methyltransferase 1
MKPIRFGSVCSGIEAASVAWQPLGWRAAWLAEIEPFPSAVLAHHYPDVPNLGDMTKLPESIASGAVEAPDIFCGGTPCQAFSVAGLRKSLDDARGNLSLVFCEIANAIDTARLLRAEQPATIFWENVPGVLNTKDNAFGCFLAGLAGEDDPLVPPGDKWTNAGCVYGPKRAVAWRVLDAQYFGVAQRRRRVFVVASARADFDPAAVLFEFDGVRRDTAPSREKGKDTAGSTGDGIARCITAGEMKRQDWETCNMVAHSLRGEGFDASEDGTGRGTPLVPVCFDRSSPPPTLLTAMQVRRLTPEECEALQGFPRLYTQIPWRKKSADQCPDGPRYKALGNSWAVPNVRWIGQRIDAAMRNSAS